MISIECLNLQQVTKVLDFRYAAIGGACLTFFCSQWMDVDIHGTCPFGDGLIAIIHYNIIKNYVSFEGIGTDY